MTLVVGNNLNSPTALNTVHVGEPKLLHHREVA